MVQALRISLGVLAISALASAPTKAATAPFLPHQALYELSLVKSRGSSPINSARGRILYNFTGSVCEGYTSEFGQGHVVRSALDLMGRRRRQDLSLQDRDADE